MLDKALLVEADAVVFDLEDSVPLAEKATARLLVSNMLANWPTSSAPIPFVRVNPPRVGVVRQDIEVVTSSGGAGIIVPKVDLPIELDAVFDSVGRHTREVIVNIETPRSLLHAEAFADTPGVSGLFLGSEDLTNAMGTRRTSAGDELSWPRFLILTAARAAGIAAYDTIHPDFRNLDVVRRDCERAAALGFDGKFAIHPAQVPIINQAFTPSEADIDRARRIVEMFDEAVTRAEGAVAVDGQMVDPPVAERARALLRRAGDAKSSAANR